MAKEKPPGPNNVTDAMSPWHRFPTFRLDDERRPGTAKPENGANKPAQSEASQRDELKRMP